MGKHVDGKLQRVAGPPEGAAWLWHTLELRSSPAWRARSPQLAKLLDLLELEHLRHGGYDNGHLRQTYGQINAGGLSAKYVAATIEEGEGLGLLSAEHGMRVSKTESRMTTFRLTYLPAKVIDPSYQGGKPYYTAPSDEWKRVTAERAAAVVKRAAERRRKASGDVKNEKRCPDREQDHFRIGNSDSSGSGTAVSETRRNAEAENALTVPDREDPSISWLDSSDEQQHVEAGRQHVQSSSSTLPTIIHDARQVDLEDLLGCKPKLALAPIDQLRADLALHLEHAPKGEVKRIAELLGLSGPQISNFKAGRFGLNVTAASTLRQYLAEWEEARAA